MGSLCQREKHIRKGVQQRAMKVIKALDPLSSEERQSKVGLFSLVKRRLRKDLISV